MFTQDDQELILFLAGGGGTCSLDSSPKTNWVERGGGLPNYICRIARAVMRSGKSKSSAIAIAVSRTKKWAAGADGVDAKTRAKAAAAVAQWEKLRAANKAKQVVKATRDDGSEYLLLAASYNTDMVRKAWDAQERIRRTAWQAANPASPGYSSGALASSPLPYRYVREIWSDYIIVENDDPADNDDCYQKFPFTVADDGDITFGDPVDVKQVWQEVPEDDNDGDISEVERYLLSDVLQSSGVSPLGKIVGIYQKG